MSKNKIHNKTALDKSKSIKGSVRSKVAQTMIMECKSSVMVDRKKKSKLTTRKTKHKGLAKDLY